MSDLSSQLSAFKNKIKTGPSVSMPRRPITSPLKRNYEEFKKNDSPKEKITVNDAIKIHKENLSKLPGSHLATQLHLAVEYIKNQAKPVSIADLSNYLSSTEITNTLIPLLQEIDRIKYSPEKKTFEYASLHDIKSNESLINFLKNQKTFKGISVKELKDGWPQYLKAINELEQENKILVLRTKKENTPRLLWFNSGGNLNLIDDEFSSMWSTIKIPNQEDLYKSLIDQGLKPTGADPNIIKRRPKGEEKKQKKTRRGKITNTHMKGILKDYSLMM